MLCVVLCGVGSCVVYSDCTQQCGVQLCFVASKLFDWIVLYCIVLDFIVLYCIVLTLFVQTVLICFFLCFYCIVFRHVYHTRALFCDVFVACHFLVNQLVDRRSISKG